MVAQLAALRGEEMTAPGANTHLPAEERLYQPRYLAYCRAHGLSPNEMMAHDLERFPGGLMAGFVLWLGARWQEWFAEVGHQRVKNRFAYVMPEEHEAFSAWLLTKTPLPLKDGTPQYQLPLIDGNSMAALGEAA